VDETLVGGRTKGEGRGVHHKAVVSQFVFRFNRRFYTMTAFASVLGIGVNLIGPTYRGLSDGTWGHGGEPNKAKPP